MTEITYAIIACYPDKGMKSYGSKGLIHFDKKRFIEHQIDVINSMHNKKYKHEIIVIGDFDVQKIEKAISDRVSVVSIENFNPIHRACIEAKYKQILFIDYGCLFNKNLLLKTNKNYSEVVCTKNYKIGKLDIGCIINNNKIDHMFFDLPDHKFCNIFYLSNSDISKILNQKKFHNHNLLYFEMINMLIDTGSVIGANHINNNEFIYFNNMRQKNAITKFIKKISN